LSLARLWPEMAYEIRITDNAREDFLALDARWRSAVKMAMESHLRLEPAKASKSRIKRLRGLRQPQYRLRVDSIRVFYDIEGGHVIVLGIVPKDQAEFWLARHGEAL
jgi:mRNA interferase RelE/StbE